MTCKAPICCVKLRWIVRSICILVFESLAERAAADALDADADAGKGSGADTDLSPALLEACTGVLETRRFFAREMLGREFVADARGSESTGTDATRRWVARAVLGRAFVRCSDFGTLVPLEPPDALRAGDRERDRQRAVREPDFPELFRFI